MGGKAFRKIKARIPCSHLARSHSLGPLFPRSLRPTLPKRRSTNQQRKSRAKKIKGIRRALLPLTYILPSARGGPAADGSCSAGGDTGLTARPDSPPRPPTRPSGSATPPKLGAGPVPATTAPHGSRPSRTSLYLARVAVESFLRGGAWRAPLLLRRNHRHREGRKEGGREVATQVNRRPRRDSGAVVNPSDGSALTPARPEGSVPSGRASCPAPPAPRSLAAGGPSSAPAAEFV